MTSPQAGPGAPEVEQDFSVSSHRDHSAEDEAILAGGCPRNGRRRITVSSVLLAVSLAERALRQRIKDDPVGLRKFDLGLIPASVTPPKTWRRAAWFTVVSSACVLMGLLVAVELLVSHSRPAGINALPNYPGLPALVPTVTTTEPSAVPPHTTRWTSPQVAHLGSHGSVDATAAPERRDDASGASSSTGSVIGTDSSDGTVSGFYGDVHAGSPSAGPSGSVPTGSAQLTPSSSRPTSSIEPTTHPTDAPTSSTANQPSGQPLLVSPPAITTTPSSGTAALTVDVTRLAEQTHRFYNSLETDLHDVLTILTGERGVSGDGAVERRHQGISRVKLEAIEVDADRGVTVSTVRVITGDGRNVRQKRVLGFSNGSYPLIASEQVLPDGVAAAGN